MESWITTDPEILGGKPYLRGTRISVQHVLELLASGAAQEEILRVHPQITPAGLAAALRYAAQSMKNEVVWDIQISA